jgi:hypothetical protein
MVKQQNNGELVWKLQTSKILVNKRKKKEKNIGGKKTDKNKVKKRLEEKLKQCYIGPCKKNTNLPTFTFIFFSSYSSPSPPFFYQFLLAFTSSAGFPPFQTSLTFRFPRNKLTFESQFFCLTFQCLFPKNIKWNNSQ